MLYSVKSGVSFSHVHFDYGHSYLTCTIWSGKEIMTTAFPLDFFLYFSLRLFVCILYQLLLFLLWRCLEKINQMWSEYHFLIFSRILVQINAKEFSENSRETLWFSRTILLGNLARAREYKQYRKQKHRQQKGDENSTVRFFSGKVPFFGTGGRRGGFRRESRGESNLTCLSPGESHPKLDKLTHFHPFYITIYWHTRVHFGFC